MWRWHARSDSSCPVASCPLFRFLHAVFWHVYKRSRGGASAAPVRGVAASARNAAAAHEVSARELPQVRGPTWQ